VPAHVAQFLRACIGPVVLSKRELAFWQADKRYPSRMDLTPFDMSDSSRASMPSADVPRSSPGQPVGSAMAMRWAVIHQAAEAVSFLADIPLKEAAAEVKDFPETMRLCGGWRRDLAEQGVEDLIAILEPGVTALLAVHDSGTDAKPAAMALWQEFANARDALIALAPPAMQDCA
jgi:hypothetical protein